MTYHYLFLNADKHVEERKKKKKKNQRKRTQLSSKTYLKIHIFRDYGSYKTTFKTFKMIYAFRYFQ